MSDYTGGGNERLDRDFVTGNGVVTLSADKLRAEPGEERWLLEEGYLEGAQLTEN